MEMSYQQTSKYVFEIGPTNLATAEKKLNSLFRDI